MHPMNKFYNILTFLFFIHGQIFSATPQSELDERHDYTRASSMEAGKRLFTAGLCTIVAGEIAVAFLGPISSTHYYGSNASTYFAPYNYPLILGDGLLALGANRMASYLSTAKDSRFKPSSTAFPVYLVATCLDIAGIVMLNATTRSGKPAALLPVEISPATAPGIYVCLAGSALHVLNTIQYLIENRKIRNEVAVRISPAIDPNTRQLKVCLSLAMGL
jgi:hypothetical protein